MSSLEGNKLAAAGLLAMILAMGSGILASEIVKVHALKETVFMVPGAEVAAASTGGASSGPAGPEPIEPFMAKADPAKGQAIAKVCLQCHTFEQGGPNKIGPNLFGVISTHMAHSDAFPYSANLADKKSQQWTPVSLNEFLYKPAGFIKGTKMTFAGLPKAEERANVIAYLESLK